jgi:hypothetical protein
MACSALFLWSTSPGKLYIPLLQFRRALFNLPFQVIFGHGQDLFSLLAYAMSKTTVWHSMACPWNPPVHAFQLCVKPSSFLSNLSSHACLKPFVKTFLI